MVSLTCSVRDSRGPTIDSLSSESSRSERYQLPDDLEHLQNGQPFIGNDGFFHPEDFDMDGPIADLSPFEQLETVQDSEGDYAAHIRRARDSISGTGTAPEDDPNLPSETRHFYQFWREVMSFFFPSSKGYTMQQDWSPYGLPPSPSPICFSIAIFRDYPSRAAFHPYSSSARSRRRSSSHIDSTSRSPIAVIKIFSPLDFRNALLRETAARETTGQFEEMARSAQRDTMLVVTAMGCAWRAWQKNVHISDEESRRWGLTSREGLEGMEDSEWMEDVGNEVSRDILSNMCEDVKRQCSRAYSRRRATYHHPQRRRTAL
ncbi:hypothetical protein PM082_001364 [Marasmius tenuissimus]|nr:hypothetical protein PM082_001364 [Marasmius tenuissimus]